MNKRLAHETMVFVRDTHGKVVMRMWYGLFDVRKIYQAFDNIVMIWDRTYDPTGPRDVRNIPD